MAQIKITQTSNADMNIGVSKQTAIDWLIQQLKHYCINLDKEFIAQAKQMEKEQIIKAVDSNFNYDTNEFPTIGEQYYNETYDKQ